MLADICRFFAIDPDCAIRTGFYRPNLTLRTTPVDAAERDRLLLERLRTRKPGPTIIYVTLQRTAEELAARLSAEGFPSRPYHAGMEDNDRVAVQEWFLESARGIVVATIAFGMGIDKADIRYVYHYNPPKSLENLSQEIGRAGRDGQPAVCEVLFCNDDLNALENFAYGDTPTAEAVAALVAEVFALGESFDVSLYELSAAHDIRTLVVRTLLCYLELLGYLEGGTPFYASYQFKPLATSAEILARFDPPRREFLAGLFRHATKAKIWFQIDVERTARDLGCPRDRVVRALDYLGEQRLLELQVSGVRNRYRRLREPDDLAELARTLHERTLQRETREMDRLREVLDWVGHDGCQVSHLGAHFAEPLPKPCGHCSWCLAGQKPVLLAERRTPPIDAELWRRAAAVREKHGQLLANPRVMTRWLCGISSPSLSRAKLTSDPLFGSLAGVPFADVLRRAGGHGC